MDQVFTGFTQSDCVWTVFNVFPGSGASRVCCQPTFGTAAAEICLFLTDHQHTARGEVTFMVMRTISGNRTEAKAATETLISAEMVPRVCVCRCSGLVYC